MKTLTHDKAMQSASSALSTIQQADPSLRAWSYLDEKLALSNARIADEKHYDKELYGVVVAVKDIFDTVDMPTCYGSPIYRDHRPTKDASVVTRLRESGAIVLGKTATTEFASSFPSATRNPRNTDHSPGGSSSGSAAAVASGMVPVALGTQTLGSIIRPASYCGVVGFKPSYGRISRLGVMSLSETLDTVGVIGRSIADIEPVYRCLADDRTERPSFPKGTPRIAFCQAPGWKLATEWAKSALAIFLKRLKDRGVAVDELHLPDQFSELPTAGMYIHDFEVRRNFAWEHVRHPGELSPNFREILERGARVTLGDYEGAIRFSEECRARFVGVLNKVDMLITLSATDEAPEGQNTTGSPALNTAWTLLRGPCVSLPMLKGAKGLPIGIQLVGTQFSDSTLLNAARWLEALGIQED